MSIRSELGQWLRGKGVFPKVNTFLVGVQKAGTSSLHNTLVRHPQIHGASQPYAKETHFWNNNEVTKPKTLQEYHSLYPFKLGKSQRTLDSTPDYIYTPDTIREIHSYNPNSKYIVTLREPVSRAYSAWKMFNLKHQTNDVWRGAKHHDPRSFEEAIHEELSGLCRYQFNYLNFGSYARMIDDLKTIVPEHQLKIIIIEEDLYPNPKICLQEIQQFLGVKTQELSLSRANKSKDKRKMDAAIEQKLTSYFELKNVELRKLLNRPIPSWKS